jgi:hypothetical protein
LKETLTKGPSYRGVSGLVKIRRTRLGSVSIKVLHVDTGPVLIYRHYKN